MAYFNTLHLLISENICQIFFFVYTSVGTGTHHMNS